MKIIDDTSSERLGFPLRKLISSVAEACDEKLDSVFRIVLFGGGGPRIWEVESRRRTKVSGTVSGQSLKEMTNNGYRGRDGHC